MERRFHESGSSVEKEKEMEAKMEQEEEDKESPHRTPPDLHIGCRALS